MATQLYSDLMARCRAEHQSPIGVPQAYKDFMTTQPAEVVIEMLRQKWVCIKCAPRKVELLLMTDLIDYGRADCLDIVLKQGFNPNQWTDPLFCNFDDDDEPEDDWTDRTTPLMDAINDKQTECVKVLLAHGADVNAYSSWMPPPLTIAVDNNNFEICELLVAAGVNVNFRNEHDDDNTALHSAVRKQASNIVSLLIEAGADVEAMDAHGRLPIDYCPHDNDMLRAILTGGGSGTKAARRSRE